MLVFVEMQIASADALIAKHSVSRCKFRHDQPASTEVLDEAAKDGVGDPSHGCQHSGGSNADIAYGEGRRKIGRWSDGRLARPGHRIRIVPELLHKSDSTYFSLRSYSSGRAVDVFKSKSLPQGRLSEMRTSVRQLLLRYLSGFRGFGFARIALSVFAAETFDATGGVHKLLLTGEKRMTGGADFYADIALVRGSGGKRVATGAMHVNFVIAGMNGCFHVGS
jgi:hypothetical protein